jgi:hypothetical protein
MPQCPICKAGVWVGQRYCSTCNSYLPQPEEAEHRCPRCGLRLAPQQQLCQECKASLPRLAGTPAVMASSRRRFPRVLIFLATALAIIGLLWLALRHPEPGPPERLVTPPPQAGSEQLPAAAPAPAAEAAPSAPAAQEPSGPAVVPASPAPPAVAAPAPSPPRYSVRVRRLALRAGPSNSAPLVAILKFADEVELLETAGAWVRVRHEERHLVGWASRRYFKQLAADDSLTPASRHLAD